MFPTSMQLLYSSFSECQIIQELFQDRNWAENPILLSPHVFDAVDGTIQDAEISFQMLPKYSYVPVNLQTISWASVIFNHARV